MRKSDYATDQKPVAGKFEAPVLQLSIPDRDGVVHEFPNGVRGQESVWLDLQFPGIACTAEEDKARQEHALASQIGYQISRFGVGHPVNYGEQDFDSMDLTRSMQIIEEASQRWLTLPRVIRDRYQSWRAVEAAAASGELEQLLRTAGVPAGSSGGAPAVPPSDSAAVPPAVPG